MSDRQLSALHLFCGVGGAALGYQRAGFTSPANAPSGERR